MITQPSTRVGQTKFLAAIAIALMIMLATAIEVSLIRPLRLPGHRVLPLALTVLSAAQTLPLPAVALVCAAVPTAAMLLAPHRVSPLLVLATWSAALATAVVLRGWLARSKTIGPWLGAGTLVAVERFAISAGTGAGTHGTAMRLVGHAVFGLLGALLAYAAVKGRSRTT